MSGSKNWLWLLGFGALFVLAGGTGMAYAIAFSRGKPIGPIQINKVDGVWMEAKTAQAWLAMKAAAAKAGIKLIANSGFRDMADQIRLYGLYKAGLGNIAAQPGYSNHQSGRALDIAVGKSWSSPESLWLEANASKFGFSRSEGKAVNEPHHIVRVG